MGKAKKIKVSKAPRNQPLKEQMEEDDVVGPSQRRDKERQRQADEEEAYVDAKLSKNILSQARMQLQEMEEEADEPERDDQPERYQRLEKPKKIKKKTPIKLVEDKDDSSEDDDEEEDITEDGGDADWRQLASEMRISQKDESAFEQFRRQKVEEEEGPINLADVIMAKLEERRTEIASQFSESQHGGGAELDPRVVEMYESVGLVLEKYRGGKVPKAFKVIPQFRNWEELAALTKPDKWSAAAVFKATRIFTSGLNEKMAQRFFNMLLLPRIRDDIQEYQRLNFHLYQSLRKALFKPGAFFKGLLLPLCEERDCTLREATIIGSVLAKNSVPVLHSCAAMLKIAEMEYSGANSIFLRILLDKKYALPFRVVDSVVFHFLRFRNEKRELPVLWHQALLTFMQVRLLAGPFAACNTFALSEVQGIDKLRSARRPD